MLIELLLLLWGLKTHYNQHNDRKLDLRPSLYQLSAVKAQLNENPFAFFFWLLCTPVLTLFTLTRTGGFSVD